MALGGHNGEFIHKQMCSPPLYGFHTPLVGIHCTQLKFKVHGHDLEEVFIHWMNGFLQLFIM